MDFIKMSLEELTVEMVMCLNESHVLFLEHVGICEEWLETARQKRVNSERTQQLQDVMNRYFAQQHNLHLTFMAITDEMLLRPSQGR